MHELSLTQAIIDTVTKAANGAPVQRVVLEIGELTAVLPESIRFCFEACTPGTLLAGAVLEIVTVAGRGRCRNCGHEMAMDIPYGVCEVCDGMAIDIIGGQDFILKSVETALCV